MLPKEEGEFYSLERKIVLLVRKAFLFRNQFALTKTKSLGVVSDGYKWLYSQSDVKDSTPRFIPVLL